MNSFFAKGGKFFELLMVSQAGSGTVSGRWVEYVAGKE